MFTAGSRESLNIADADKNSLTCLMEDLNKNLEMFSRLIEKQPLSSGLLQPVYNELEEYTLKLKQKEAELINIYRYFSGDKTTAFHDAEKVQESSAGNEAMENLLLDMVPVLDQQLVLLRMFYKLLNIPGMN